MNVTKELNRAELIEALHQMGVKVPSGAKIARLRTLYTENVKLALQQTSRSRKNSSSESDDDIQQLPTPPKNRSKNRQESPPTQDRSNRRNENTQGMMNSTPHQSRMANIKRVDVQVHQAQDDDEDEQLERELQKLRKRHEILRLRREIEQMERGEQVGQQQQQQQPMVAATARKTNFHDIEHAIVKFNGEDRAYSVNDFFRHLEEIFTQVNADNFCHCEIH